MSFSPFNTLADLNVSNEAYARSVGIPLAGSSIESGQVYVANDSMLTEGTFNQPLTSYAVSGWDRADDAGSVLDKFFPPLVVTRRFTYKVWNNDEAFHADITDQDIRAINAEFARVQYTNTEAEGKTQNRGLTYRLDKDQIAEGVFTEQKIVDMLTRRLKRNSLYRAFALLEGVDTPTSETWSAGAVDCDYSVQARRMASADITGILPNTVAYGETAWNNRYKGYGLSTAAGGFAGRSMTIDQVGSMLMIPNIGVVSNRYTSGAAAKTSITALATKVWCFNSSNESVEDYSTIKRFVSRTDSGAPVEVSRTEHGSKFIDITVQHYESIVITSNPTASGQASVQTIVAG